MSPARDNFHFFSYVLVTTSLDVQSLPLVNFFSIIIPLAYEVC